MTPVRFTRLPGKRSFDITDVIASGRGYRPIGRRAGDRDYPLYGGRNSSSSLRQITVTVNLDGREKGASDADHLQSGH